MATRGKKRLHGLIDEVDRISDFPEYVLHHILSFLGTKEACRTCILSKKWSSVWDTIPFLDFHEENFTKEYYDFIDRTMHRYSNRNLCVKKLKLQLPVADLQVARLIDSWLQIVAMNGLEELNISFSCEDFPNYRLPEILFSAKSLKILRCRNVELPYYQVMKLTALRILDLDTVNVDEGMLQYMISSCPLINLELTKCIGLANISVPPLSKLKILKVRCVTNANVNIVQETRSLRTLDYEGDGETWPCKINARTLRNLKELYICCTCIADGDFSNLMTELLLLDTLGLYECDKLQNLNISSNRLKYLDIQNCSDLKNMVIEAPNLAIFLYNGYLPMSLSFTNSQPQCDAEFNVQTESNNTTWFIKLKELLIQSNICKVLNIYLENTASMSIDMDELREILVEPAYELKELKISVLSDWKPTESLLSDFLEGLFLICRPAALSISSSLEFDNSFVKSLVKILKKKAKSRQHSLKGIQVESIDCPSKLDDDSCDVDLNFNIRLCW